MVKLLNNYAQGSDNKERKVRRAKKRKGIEALRLKHPTSYGKLKRSQGMKSRMENRRKQNERKQGAGSQSNYPGPFSRRLRIPTPATAGLAFINTKERQGKRAKKRKGIELQRVKHQTTSRAIDVLLGNENQNKKQNKPNRKRCQEG